MLDKYFEYRKHKTNFKTEVRGGTAIFLTMAYILALNPMILSAGGFDKGSFFFSNYNCYSDSLWNYGFLGTNLARGTFKRNGLK